jgi:hypothetical protein
MALVIIIVGIVGVILAAGAAQRHWLRLRQIAAGLLLSYLTVLLLLAGAELYFRFIHYRSENNPTLASMNWKARFWQENTLGFRDVEWTAADLQGRTTVVVLGDSFAAGWGVNDPADRFSDVLAARLGQDYAVLNMAISGTSTPEQLDILRAWPFGQPDVVILQYFLNDINYAALRLGLLPQVPQVPPLARESWLANFIYWGITPQRDYWEWAYPAYDNVGIWEIHRAELDEFAAYAESLGSRLVVVIFPNMADPVGSIAYVDRVAQVFEARGQTDILRLFDAAAAWPLDELIVSRWDGHPSPAFHRYVGDTLYEQFFVGE